MEDLNNIIGKKFNRATVVEIIGRDKNHNLVINCKCDCGNIFKSIYTRIKNGYIRSCGCLAR